MTDFDISFLETLVRIPSHDGSDSEFDWCCEQFGPSMMSIPEVGEFKWTTNMHNRWMYYVEPSLYNGVPGYFFKDPKDATFFVLRFGACNTA